jgi:glucosamine-6-phosphate deaminase
MAVCHLDERAGLPPTDPDSFAFQIGSVWDGLHIPLSHRYSLKGNTPPAETVSQFKTYLAKSPRTLTVLGIGEDGHIAFVMPGDQQGMETHYVPRVSEHVIERDLKRNGRSFPSGITMGITDILDTQYLMLVATGNHKAEAVSRMLHDEIGLTNPSAFVRKHPKVVILLDAEAASALG